MIAFKIKHLLDQWSKSSACTCESFGFEQAMVLCNGTLGLGCKNTNMFLTKLLLIHEAIHCRNHQREDSNNGVVIAGIYFRNEKSARRLQSMLQFGQSLSI